MKAKFYFLAAAGAFLAATAAADAATYTITNAPGWNLIANQLDAVNGNNIRVVLANPPIGSQLRKFNRATKTFNPTEIFTAAGGWLPGTNILNPGDGLVFSNALTSAFVLTISGNPHLPALPVNIGPGLTLLSRQTNDPGLFLNVMGYLPPNNTVVYRFNPGPGRDPNIFDAPHYTIYAFQGGAWTPSPPTNRVGESWWVTTNGTAPSIVNQPAGQAVCLGARASFSVGATGTLPLSYQWFLNGSAISGANGSSYLVPAVQTIHLGDYFAVVSNPLGSATSAVATLTLLTQTATGPVNQTNCVGTRAVLSTTPGGNPPFTFQWYKDGALLPNQTGSTLTIASLTAANAGTYCVVVTGGCGSVTNCAYLAVGDFQPPALNCPKDIVTRCAGFQGTPVQFGVGITDNCDTNPTVTCVPPSGSRFFPGITPVTCTGRDASGNTSTCSFNVVVLDSPPDLICPQDRLVVATSRDGAVVTFAPSVFDDCHTNVSVNCLPPSGSTFPIGSTVVTCVATDPGSNSSSCTFTIQVVPSSCCDNKQWLPFGQTSLTARQGHAMAYDGVRGQVMLFGGNVGTLIGDTLEWNGTDWISVATAGPGARELSAMAYDSARQVVVLFGGNGPNGPTADTWEWNGTLWRPIDVAGPTARHSHSMAYDPNRRTVVLYGGTSATGGELSDTWEYDGTKWVGAPTGIPSPGPRTGHALAWDGKYVVLFGGQRSGVSQADTWSWLGDRWAAAASTGPSARTHHAMAFDENCHRVALFGGGTSAATVFGDTWEWDGSAWALKATNGPVPRWQLGMAYDSTRGQTILAGGGRVVAAGSGRLADTWAWIPDSTPARLRAVDVLCDDNKVTLVFDKPLLPGLAENPAVYHVSCGGVENKIVLVVLLDDLQTVCLFLESPLAAGQSCLLTVNGLIDLCGNRVPGIERTLTCRPDPCPRGNTGTEYWLTFPGNYAPDLTNQPRPRLFITGDPGTLGTVSVPGLAPPFNFNYTIPASRVATVVLPRQTDLGDANDIIEKKGIHVTASRKVSVYGHNYVNYTTDTYLGIAKPSLGMAYLVMTYQNVFNGVPELSGVQFAIAGTEDATSVAILPSAAVGPHPAGVPFGITLNQGETYQLRDTNNPPADLSGTIVVANRPIAVFGSHQCANIPSSNVFFCDYIVEQMPPAEWAGSVFYTMPLATRTGGDTFRFMALYNGTTVFLNGAALAGVVDQGHFRELLLTGPAQVVSDKPILVAQYANSADFDLVMNSDPFMAMLTPTTMWGESYTIEVPPFGFGDNYVNIVCPAAGIGHILRDGVVIPAARFVPIFGGYAGAQVHLGLGPHTLTSDNGTLFSAIVYGWNEFTSYGYPAGMCSPRDVQPPPRFSCPPANLTVQVGPDCTAPAPNLAAQVGNADQAVLITQQPPAGTRLPVGSYTIVTTIVDQFGNRTTCQTILTVVPSAVPQLNCPQGVVTNCASKDGQVVSYTVSICSSNFTITCVPPSGSLFPVGTTSVDCRASSPTGASDRCSFRVTVQCAVVGISVSPGNAVLTWNGDGHLQKATSVTGPWIAISNAVSPFRISVADRQAFFRLAP